MSVGLYMDVHVPQAITDQLRRRGVDVLTVIEDGKDEIEDSDLLDRARSLNRVLFTQDILFKAPRRSGSARDESSPAFSSDISSAGRSGNTWRISS